MEDAMMAGEGRTDAAGREATATGGRSGKRASGGAAARLAPEVKAAPDTVTAAFAEFMTAFEASRRRMTSGWARSRRS